MMADQQRALNILGRIPGAGLAAAPMQTASPNINHDSYITAPRYANSKKLLWQAAHYHNLKLTITDHDKGWIRETIYYTVIGKPSDVKAFDKSIIETLQEWNNR